MLLQLGYNRSPRRSCNPGAAAAGGEGTLYKGLRGEALPVQASGPGGAPDSGTVK